MSNHRKKRFRNWSLLLFLLLMAAPAWAQIDRGTIVGLVKDQSGAVIPNAKVQIIQIATNNTYDLTTNAEGLYIAPNLPASTYRVVIQAPGFAAFSREPVEVRARVEARVDAVLKVGAPTEKITVTADAPLLDTAPVNNSVALQTKMIEDLPLIVAGTKRDITSFLNNLPGTTSANTFVPSVNGSQFGQTEAFIDGAPASERIFKGGISENGPMIEQVGEVSVVTSAFNAEYGGFGNWFTNITIKSGTNELHGSVFNHLGNDVLNARSFFAPKRTKYRQNEGGFTLGGPVVIPHVYDGRNKTFFFGSLGWFFSRVGSGGSIITIPTQAFINGDFSGLVNAAGNQIPIFDPATTQPDGKGGYVRTQFQGNKIPANRISPMAKAIVAYIPPTDLAGAFNNFYDHKAPTWPYYNTWTPLIKIDHSISNKQKLQGSFTAQRRPRLLWGNPGSGLGDVPKWGEPQKNPLDWITDQVANSWKIRVSHDYVFSPRLLSHFTLAVDSYYNLGYNKTRNQGWLNKMGLAGIPADNGSFPQISFSGGTGSPVQFGRAYDEDWHDRRYSIYENLSWINGKHSMKFGFSFEKDTMYHNMQSNASGTFAFSNSMTSQQGSSYGSWGSSFASFLLGEVSSVSAYIPVATNHAVTRYAAYAQDEWRATPALTVSYGLRWDVNLPVSEAENKMSSFQPNLTNPGAGGRPGALGFAGAGSGRVGDNFQDTWLRGFGPRLGIAYQISPKMVMRASSGVYYGSTQMSGNAPSPSSQGFSASVGFSSPDAYTPLYNVATGTFPQSFVRPPAMDPSFLNGQAIQFTPRTGTRLPQTLSWTLSIQREVLRNLSVEAVYLGSRSTHLGFNQNYNFMPISGLQYGSLLLQSITSAAAVAAGFKSPYPGFENQRGANTVYQSLRPYPQFTSVTNGPIQDPVGQQKFNSLQIKANRRFSQGLSVLGWFTWSKGFSYAKDQYPGYWIWQLDANPAAAFGFSWTYELPFGSGKLSTGSKIANAVLHGWKINGSLRYNSGAPLGIGAAAGQLGAIGYSQRGNAVPGVSPYLVTNPREFTPSSKYLNYAAFTTSTGFNFGNLAPVLSWVRGFWGKQEALTIGRLFRLHERLQLDISVDATNPFNFHRWGNPNTSLTSAAFGTVTTTSDGRIMQVNAVVRF
jgi:hypothetical protein